MLKRCFCFCLVLLSALGISWAQPQEAAELESFIDELMTVQLEQYQVPGSVVVIVQDGEVALAKGYGYANLERLQKVDPETSMFRIASISKLFIYTSVMQLVEEGKLDLDVPIVDYLSSAGLSTEGIDERTTLKHLMTHSAGFEITNNTWVYSRDAEDVRPLNTIVGEKFPAQIRAPGSLAAYSNSGLGLLGLIVEIASGMTWTDYIEAHILEPLGMTHSTGQQPVPDDLTEFLVTGYNLAGGNQQAQDFVFVPLGPAGGMSASGLDLAQFMLAHLQEGEGILKPETAQTMHSTLFQHDPRLPGFAYGFFETDYSGQRTIGHSGTLANFISHLWLVPDHDLGIFISYNSHRGMMAQYAFAHTFFEHYFPHEPAPALSLEAKDLKPYTGMYQSSLINLTTSEKFNNLRQFMFVQSGNNGNLQIYSGVIPPMEVEPLGEGLFRDVNTGEHVVVTERDGLGHVFLGNWPDHAFTEIAWYKSSLFHVVLFLVAILVFLSLIIVSTRSAFVQRRKGAIPKPFERWARITASVMGLAFTAFIISQFVAMLGPYGFGVPAYLTAISTTLPVGVILAFVTVIFAVLAWRQATWRLGTRLHYSLVALLGLSVVGQLTYFNQLMVF